MGKERWDGDGIREDGLGERLAISEGDFDCSSLLY